MAKRNSADETPSAGLISADIAGRLLMVTPKRVRQLVEEGYIPRPTERGQYSLVGCVQGYIRFLKDEERRATKTAADARVRDARAREIELRIAEREGRLIDYVEHDSIVAELVGIMITVLDGLPARVTRDLALRAAIQEVCDECLNRASDLAAKRAAELRATAQVST